MTWSHAPGPPQGKRARNQGASKSCSRVVAYHCTPAGGQWRQKNRRAPLKTAGVERAGRDTHNGMRGRRKFPAAASICSRQSAHVWPAHKQCGPNLWKTASVVRVAEDGMSAPLLTTLCPRYTHCPALTALTFSHSPVPVAPLMRRSPEVDNRVGLMGGPFCWDFPVCYARHSVDGSTCSPQKAAGWTCWDVEVHGVNCRLSGCGGPALVLPICASPSEDLLCLFHGPQGLRSSRREGRTNCSKR